MASSNLCWDRVGQAMDVGDDVVVRVSRGDVVGKGAKCISIANFGEGRGRKIDGIGNSCYNRNFGETTYPAPNGSKDGSDRGKGLKTGNGGVDKL